MHSGCDVHVAAPFIGGECPFRAELERLGVVVHRIPMRRVGINPLFDIMTVASLWWLMLRVRPNSVLAYTVKPVIYGLLAARFAGVQKRFALITGLGYVFGEEASISVDRKRAIIKWIVLRLYVRALTNIGRVFFQNPDDQALFEKLGIVTDTNLSTVVNGSGVDLMEFAVAPLPAEINFLLIARLMGDKGVREYVYAARLVKKQYPDICFSLVGWIDDNPDAILQMELDEWIAEGVIDYQGKLDDVRPAIAGCSVYVLPSYREGTPRTVLEAMSMQRPIITTDAPGCRETVIDGENGYLVEVRSVNSLVNAMMKFVNDPSLILRMAKKSREIAEQKYDVNKVNREMLRAMEVDS